MMELKKRNWLIILGVVLLAGLVVLGLFLSRFYQRGRAYNARPLVLIHAPAYHEKIQVGDGVLVHATARESEGLERMELWVNDILIDSVDAEQPGPTNLSLFSSWVPAFVGDQLIVVRAYSAAGISGQSMVQVDVAAAADLTHLVQEGETLESIADEYGTSPEVLSELNPGLEGGSPAPGDELIVPDDEPAAEPAPLPDDGGEVPPSPEGDPPLMGLVFPFFELFRPDPGNVTLRLEVPGLRTWESFDGLHCYVSLADNLPQWYPDLDLNQATDESFVADLDGWWITEGILVGDSAPIISWPADQSLPLDIDCVGIIGGSEAVELDQISLLIPPEDWDGIRKSHESDGSGGHLLVESLITQLSGDPRNTPKYPDPDMSKPTNVRLNEAERTLEWDFEAAEGEVIDGFRIYLNGNLQWTEDEDARSTRLPPEWFRPPCAWTYTFGVTAYRIEFPDGPESDPPSEVELTQPREDCMRIMRVTFLELQTFHLGDDGDFEDRHGDVGPAYGTFYANYSSVSFDHGHEGRGLDMPEGLRHNTTYDLARVSGDVGWHFDGPNSVVTEVPYEGEMQVGFIIMDRDNNPDDLLCQGFNVPIRDAYNQLDGYHRESIDSENGRCRVTFEYEPTEDSPVGSRNLGQEPLPWLTIEELDVYSNPDQTIIAVGNFGTASWPGRTLTLELQTREGVSLGQTVFEDVNIPIGETETFRIPRTTPGSLIDVCVLIDPNDQVLELYERSGALIHHPVCTDLPDMVVRDVIFSDSDRILHVSVENEGDGPVARWPLDLNITLPDGDLLLDHYRIPDLSLPGGGRIGIEIPMFDDSRARMFAGYTVSLNPDQAFPESNYDNNSLIVPEGTELSMSWYGFIAPEAVRDIVEFHIDMYIIQGRERTQHIVDWNQTQDINWGSCFEDRYCMLYFDGERRHDYLTGGHEIYGDEKLELIVEVTHPGSLWGGYSSRDIFRAPGWEAGERGPTMGCTFWPTRHDEGRHGFAFISSSGAEWTTRVDICRDNYDE
jgi:hypothetical protein